MKKIYIPLILLNFLLSSCEEVLEEEVVDFISVDNFFTNEADAVAAVNAIYRPLQIDVYRRWYQTFLEVRSDHAQHELPNPAFIAIDEFTLDATSGQNFDIWNGLYGSINNANLAIQKIPEIEDIDENRRSEIIAEAHFLRGLAYFELVRFYGGVPLKIQFTEGLGTISSPKASISEVYDLIFSDLNIARTDLPAAPADVLLGRPTRGSALGVLAQVYLTLGDFSNAKSIAEEVIALGQYGLLTNFEDIFSINNEGHAEYLFAIKYANIDSFGNGLPAWFNNGGSNNPYGNAAFAVIQGDDESDLWQNWDLTDPRRQYSLYEEYIGKDGQPISTRDGNRPFFAFGKWRDPVAFSGSVNHSNDFPIIRYAEILLIFAEAENELNGPTPAAYEAINNVRRRGYELPVNEPSAVDLSGLSQAEFRDAVFNERSHEFVSEGKRWFDLVRTERAIPILSTKTQSAGITENGLLFPIPQQEIDNNTELGPEDQNPGY